MLYLGIDQHDRQLTISLRDDNGDGVQDRQVSTRPEKIHAFFTKLTRRAASCSSCSALAFDRIRALRLLAAQARV